ncbi:MAG: SCO family protein [Hyphomicrobiaceae bacterium]
MRARLAVLIVGGLVLGTALGLLLVPGALDRLMPSAGSVSFGQATIGGPFNLINQKGQRVTDKDFRGRYMLVYFGFTFCPDVCPTALQVMTGALEKLGPKAARIAPIFISVDPERDTPEQLASYITSFYPSFVALTGTSDEVKAAARAYRVYYNRVKDPQSTAGYTMDHTSIIYLMGPDGRFISHFTHATQPDKIVESLSKLL